MSTGGITLTRSKLARNNNSESYASLVFSFNDQNFSVAISKPISSAALTVLHFPRSRISLAPAIGETTPKKIA
jgi:hypothetical protein